MFILKCHLHDSICYSLSSPLLVIQINAYVVLCTVSCAIAAGLVTCYGFAARQEVGYYKQYQYYYISECQPGGGASYVDNCHKSVVGALHTYKMSFAGL